MSHTDDPKLDKVQNPEEDQLELNILSEDAEKTDDAPLNLETFFEESTVELDLPNESLLGENTATFADELDMFGDLQSRELTNEGTIVSLGDLDIGAADAIETSEYLDGRAVDFESGDRRNVDGTVVEEIADTVDELVSSEETDDLLGGLETVVDPTEMPDDHVLVLPVEDVPVVEDKKAKKAKKEKPPKKEKAPKVKKEKKPREPREKRPWNISATENDVALGIAAISLFVGSLFLFANLMMN